MLGTQMRTRVGTVEINYESSGRGTPLVLTHGLGNALDYWADVAEPLARYHHVICWDVRGFGASDKPPGPYSTAMFAADLEGLLGVLGLDRVHLLGISMGGVIAQRFALDCPTRLRSLVLVSTSSEVGAQATANWQRLADRIEHDGIDPSVANATRSFSPVFAERHPDVVAAMGARTAANDAKAYAAAARAVSAYDWTADLRAVTTPTLILQGLDDQLTPPGGSVKMSRSLPNHRLLMIPEAGHNLPLEQPLLFINAVLAFTGAVDCLAETAPK